MSIDRLSQTIRLEAFCRDAHNHPIFNGHQENWHSILNAEQKLLKNKLTKGRVINDVHNSQHKMSYNLIHNLEKNKNAVNINC